MATDDDNKTQKLWRLTFVEPMGRTLARTPVSVIAATAEEARDKMLTKLLPILDAVHFTPDQSL